MVDIPKDDISIVKEYKLRIKNGEFPCSVCGEKNNLTMHHIDGNRRNNKESNFKTVCYSCHTIEHYDRFIKNINRAWVIQGTEHKQKLKLQRKIFSIYVKISFVMIKCTLWLIKKMRVV